MTEPRPLDFGHRPLSEVIAEAHRRGLTPEPERAEGETRTWSPTLGCYLPSLDFAKRVGHDGDHHTVLTPRPQVGWFSDIDNDREHPVTNSDGSPMWQPCIQTSYFCGGLGIWFATEAECDTFIREEIFDRGWHPGEGDRG